MKVLGYILFSSLLSLSSLASLAFDVEDLKDGLQGEFKGKDCGLTIDTQWYGNGYYKRFTFTKKAKVFDIETFHVAKLARNITGSEFYLRDEVGSDGGDKEIALSMVLELDGDLFNITDMEYKYFSYNLFGIPTGIGKVECPQMIRVGPGSQLQF